MKFVFENLEYKEYVYEIGIFNLVLNQIEYVISKICEFESDYRTLGQQREYLEQPENIDLLPYWREEIISDLLAINKKRKAFIHGISFIDPNVGIDEGSSIEYMKNQEILSIHDLKDTTEIARRVFKKLLYIYIFYVDENDDAVIDSYNSKLLEKLPFTFYPVSEERGFC